MFVPDVYSTVAIRLNSAATLGSNHVFPTLYSVKIEINLLKKANPWHHLPAKVKDILDFGSNDPMKTLLYLFCEYYSRFGARCLK